ncbi:GIY-YIG nuclease family protein [Kocuria arenosa]|uniref:GIY-YIG nuclease family protein n=1 Tax=Kocuria arenosa TaxID=3071446 RepID=UPI0034D62389
MSSDAPLPFTHYPLPAGTSLSAHFARGQDRCGIYVLTHEDGTKYVGRTNDVVRRCADHVRHAGRATGERIVSVHFAPVPAAELVRMEGEVVGYCEDHGMRLRNKLLTGMSFGPSPLDATVNEAEQLAFLTDEAPEQIPDSWLRASSGATPKKNTARLLARADVSSFVDAFACYLFYALPDPAGTEGRFWMLTAPYQRMRNGHRALARLTVQNVETLVLLEDERGTYLVTNLAPYPAVRPEYRPEVIGNYTSNGPMQNLALEAPVTASALVYDPVFRTAARRAAVGLMRKGPCAQGRHHDRALADAVYTRIHDLLKETP